MLSGRLKTITLQNARLYPVEPDIQRPLEGGLTPDQVPKSFRHFRRGKVYNAGVRDEYLAADHDELKGTFIYAGVYAGHFGHMIAEFSHRLWPLERYGDDHPEVLICGRDSEPYVADYVNQIFSYLGVKKFRVITKPTRVEKLIVAEQGKQIGVASKKAYLNYVANLAERNRLFSAFNGPEKIAVLRNHLPARSIVGENELAEFLERQGYTLFRPEEHDLISQFKTLANARLIIMADGTPAHLFDLLPPTRARVFYYGRNRTFKLGVSSVGTKVADFINHLEATNLVLSLTPDGTYLRRSKNRSLLYLSMAAMTAEMKRCGFVNDTLPDVGPDIIARDVIGALDSRLPGFKEGHSPETLAIAEITRSHYEISQKFLRLKRRTAALKTVRGLWAAFLKKLRLN